MRTTLFLGFPLPLAFAPASILSIYHTTSREEHVCFLLNEECRCLRRSHQESIHRCRNPSFYSRNHNYPANNNFPEKKHFFKVCFLCNQIANLCMAPPTFIIHRVVLWIAQHIVVSFSLDADFFLVAWDGVGSVVLVKKTEKMWRKTLRMLYSVTLYCQITMSCEC